MRWRHRGAPRRRACLPSCGARRRRVVTRRCPVVRARQATQPGGSVSLSSAMDLVDGSDRTARLQVGSLMTVLFLHLGFEFRPDPIWIGHFLCFSI